MGALREAAVAIALGWPIAAGAVNWVEINGPPGASAKVDMDSIVRAGDLVTIDEQIRYLSFMPGRPAYVLTKLDVSCTRPMIRQRTLKGYDSSGQLTYEKSDYSRVTSYRPGSPGAALRLKLCGLLHR